MHTDEHPADEMPATLLCLFVMTLAEVYAVVNKSRLKFYRGVLHSLSRVSYQ